MKKVLFLTSHLGSDSSLLLNALNKHSKIDIQETNLQYQHPTDLEPLLDRGHKLNNTSAIYGDHLLYNPNFCCKSLYKSCKFIYFIREAKGTLNELINSYRAEVAANYYTFRLRRIYEMSRNTPEALFITRTDLENNKGLDLISNYLELKQPIEKPVFIEPKNTVDQNTIDYCQERYEYYWFKLTTMGLRTVHGIHHKH